MSASFLLPRPCLPHRAVSQPFTSHTPASCPRPRQRTFRKPHVSESSTMRQHVCSSCATGAPFVCITSDGQAISRRSAAAALFAFTLFKPAQALAEPTRPSSDFVSFTNTKQGYRIQRPSSWEQTSKAGADVLFTDPARKSTTVGVTVNPIRIAGLEQFGNVESVRTKLIDTEKAKESTKGVTLVQESSRKGKGGTLMYDIEYELDSTRGRKRILSTVGIAQKKLFIVNGNLKCDASACTDADQKGVALLRDIAQTFEIN